jgi:hypothetical protein
MAEERSGQDMRLIAEVEAKRWLAQEMKDMGVEWE